MISATMRRLWLVLLAAALPAQAGTVFLSFNQHATQNLFQTSQAVSDQVSAFSLAVDQDFSALSLLARLDYSAFRETSGLNFFAADLGFDYLLTAGRKSAVYLAAGGAGQFYRGGYAAFSSVGANLLGAFKTYLAPSSILKLQWQGQYASYKDSLFDFASSIASLSIDKYFPSRTTLKADAEYGYKYFLHTFVPEAAGLVAAPAAGAAVLLAASGPGGGSGGTGSGSGSGSGSGWGGQRYGGGSGFIPRVSAAGGGAGIGHVSVSLLAAQGLGDAVGLSLSAIRQWIVAGRNPFLSIEEFYLVQNPSADSFSWEGTKWTGRITLSLPWDMSVKAGYTYADTSYPGVESLDLDRLPTGQVRGDRRRLVEARLQKDFRRLSVFIAYSFVENASNDPLFVWDSHFVMGGFEWNLPTGRKRGVR